MINMLLWEKSENNITSGQKKVRGSERAQFHLKVAALMF